NRLGMGRGRKGGDEAISEARPTGSVGVRIRNVLEDLGPSFVKLGQIASTRSDVLPADVILELKRLLDDVPPLPFAAIRERVETSLGAPLSELFESFEETPLAAASVAQVHRATLRTADELKEVVVKVQRPNIAETVASDLDLLHTFAALLEHAVPESRTYSPAALVQEFDRAMQNELDFSIERENAARFAGNFRDFPGARFPLVYAQASSKHVITLEFLDGLKIYDAVRQGYDARALARLAMHIIVKQIFEDGFFHADPHPGNVLVLGTPEKPEYALIDLGMVGRLGPRMRDLTVDLMVAAAREDFDGVADAMYAIATPTRKVDMRAYRSEVALLAEKYLKKHLRDIELSGLIQDLIGTATRYGLEVPPDFVLVGKALITIEGVGKEIAPDFDIVAESRPLFLELLRKRYSPQRLGNEFLRRMERLSGATSQLPEQFAEILEDLRLGRLAIHTTDTEMAGASDRLGRRVFTALVASACLLAGTALLIEGYPQLGATMLIGAMLGVLAHWLGDTYRRLRRRR
ncbi:MAG TPA: AarF/ABC1/UbiB kinase family protein, partial [Polyangiaceae bacterium]|nr:AarF/ABC1/UbiB kinase family protein [Polyangiaceae bacterium]